MGLTNSLFIIPAECIKVRVAQASTCLNFQEMRCVASAGFNRKDFPRTSPHLAIRFSLRKEKYLFLPDRDFFREITKNGGRRVNSRSSGLPKISPISRL